MTVEIKNKKCLGCDNLIESKPNKKYCSKSCKNKAYRKEHYESNKTFTIQPYVSCLCCGKSFQQKNSASKYCSRNCREKVIRLNKLGKIEECTCESCGITFLPKRNRNTKYCSLLCSSQMWAKKNPEKRREAAKIAEKKRKDEDKEAFLEKKRANAKKNQKWSTMKRQFGLTKEQYSEMLILQNNRCKICNNILDGGSLTHIDHDHNSGKVRGILCQKCNNGLGMFNDSIQNLYNAIHYLEQNK